MDAVLIAGPTASGKSALAISLARDFNGVVVNADSMQVYRELQVLTARPTPAEEAIAPHRLYGHVAAGERYSTGRWVADVTAALDEIRADGRLPIIVGGTGLYFKALLEGLSDIPPVPEPVLAALLKEAEGEPTPALHKRLAGVDQVAAARLAPNDRQRILRALAVFEATGRPLTLFLGARTRPPLQAADCLKVFLTVERDWLRERIDRRFGAMMAAGGMGEVERLLALGLDPSLPAMRAHGVPGLIAAHRGHCSLGEAVERGKRDTRAYAKRQETWFRHQLPGFARHPPVDAEIAIRAAMARA